MIGFLRTRVRKQPMIALYFESENELKFYDLEAWLHYFVLLLSVLCVFLTVSLVGVRFVIVHIPY